MEHFCKDHAEFFSANVETVGTHKLNDMNDGFHFRVEDMLDFPKDKETLTSLTGHTSTITAVESCNSSLSGGVDGQLSENVGINESQYELCVPYDDLAELEWLSNFVEESYSTEDLHSFIPTTAVAENSSRSGSCSTQNSPSIFPTDITIPAKARSKRSRAVPCDWSTRLLHLSPPSRRREPSGQKCLHCASEKTPQWRTGPMGPKTLCNACGVRFKSGRLVPEYRPAASPTFLSSKHSNSHRKVIELRRQKQLQFQQRDTLNTVFD